MYDPDNDNDIEHVFLLHTTDAQVYSPTNHRD